MSNEQQINRSSAVSVGVVIAIAAVTLTSVGLFTSWIDGKFSSLNERLVESTERLDDKLDSQGVKLDTQGIRLQDFELRLRLIEEQGRWRQDDAWNESDMKDWASELVRMNEGLNVPKVRTQ